MGIFDRRWRAGKRGMRARAACALAASWLAVAAAGGCGRASGPSGGAAGEPASAVVADPAPEVLGSAGAGTLAVDVLRVRRLSSHLVQFDVTLTNKGAATLDLRQVWPSASGGLAESALRSASGDARTFVVRDERGRAQCSDDLEPLSPGARRDVFLRFVAPSSGASTCTLEMSGVPPIGPLQIPPGPTEKPAAAGL